MSGHWNIPIAILQGVGSASAIACILIGLILIGKRTLGRRLPPRWHYLLWFVLMVKLFVPWTPEIPLNLWSLLPDRAMPASVNAAIEAVNPILRIAPDTSIIPSIPETKDAPDLTLLILFFLWLSGALAMILRSFIANRRFARRLRKEAFIRDPVILKAFEESKSLMSVRRKIRLAESNLVSGPALFGFLRPCLIIPNLTALALQPEQLRYIFLHELAHVRRCDIAANWIMQMLLAVHWFNPVLWYAYYRMREDQEVACDALVLSRVRPDETKAYGHTLIELFEKSSAPVRAAGIASLSGNMPQIKRRMVMIQSFRPASRVRSLLGAAIVIALCLFAASIGQTGVQAASAVPPGGSFAAEDRILLFSTFDAQGVETQRRLLVTQAEGEWKIRFITLTGETDSFMNKISGKLTIPESGYFSQPGVRDLIFQKGPFDDEWKLISIEEGKYAQQR